MIGKIFVENLKYFGILSAVLICIFSLYYLYWNINLLFGAIVFGFYYYLMYSWCYLFWLITQNLIMYKFLRIHPVILIAFSIIFISTIFSITWHDGYKDFYYFLAVANVIGIILTILIYRNVHPIMTKEVGTLNN